MSRAAVVWASMGIFALVGCGGDDGPGVPAPPPPTLMTPRLVSPMSNAYLGTPTVPDSLSAFFCWENVEGAETPKSYELQISDDPLFAHLQLTVSTAESHASPATPLPISREVPVGTRYFWRVRACDETACSAFSAARALNLGRSARDFNGDGFDDILIGSQAPRSGGHAYVYFGGAGPDLDLQPDAILSAPAGVGGFAAAVAFAGDVNNDGFADIVVGAPGDEPAGPGAAFVYFGGPSGKIDLAPRIALTGRAGERLGSTVSAGGDLNGDGLADFVVGGSGSGGAGVVHVYLPNPDGSLTVRTLHDPTGEDLAFGVVGVAAGGDVDGDGLADLVVSIVGLAPVGGFLYFGDTTASFGVVDQLSAGGGDVAMGATSVLISSEHGQLVTLYRGDHDRTQIGAKVISYRSPDPGFGSRVALPNAGADDNVLIASNPQVSGGPGGVEAFRVDFGTDPTEVYDQLGPFGSKVTEWTVASLGDVDGDGVPDIAVGRSGAVTVYRSSFSAGFGRPFGVLTADAVDDHGAFGTAIQ